MSWRILFANVTLAGRTGTEAVTRDLALGLASRGHQVSVYAPTLGPLASEMSAAGLTVVSDLERLREPPEVVHGHHFVETVEALLRFPQACGVFVCHDRTAAHSAPPRLQNLRQYVAVDANCLGRLHDDWGVPPAETRVIENAVDLARFQPRPPLPARPSRALVFSHYASPGGHADIVRAACEPLGIRVDVAGSRSGQVIVPEERLRDYDLVFAKARAALEAMAVGAAVVLCDASGSGSMVTVADVPRLRPWNFGARVLSGPLDSQRLEREIARYDPAEAAAVSRVVRETASLDQALDQYEALYREVMGVQAPDRAAQGEGEGVRTFLPPLLARIARLEGDVASYQRSERMDVLSDEDVAKIHVAIEQTPSAIAAGSTTHARVRLHNGLNDRALGTWPPFPLQFAYRWRRLDAAQLVTTGSAHSPLSQSVPAGETRSMAVRVLAPQAPGRYALRIVLVQEWWRWLDEAPTPVVADAEVAVVRPTLLTSIGGAGSRT